MICIAHVSARLEGARKGMKIFLSKFRHARALESCKLARKARLV